MEQRVNKEAKYLGMSRGRHRKVRETLRQAILHYCSPGCLCRPPPTWLVWGQRSSALSTQSPAHSRRHKWLRYKRRFAFSSVFHHIS